MSTREARREEPPYLETSEGLKHLPPLRAHAFIGLLRAGQWLDQQLDAELQREHGIGLRGFEMLLHLAVFSEDGCKGLGALTEQAPCSQSRTSRLVAELESRGLVTRSRSRDDSRAVNVTITDRGRRLFVAAQETHLAGLHRHLFSKLSWEQVTQLASITKAVLESGD